MPLLSDVLAAPFGNAAPPLLSSAVRTMQTVIRNGWPRIAAYRAEVMRGLALCWCRVNEDTEGADQMTKSRHDLKSTFKLLRAALQDNVDMVSDLDILLASDERIAELVRDE